MRDKKDELASWDENLMAGGTFNPIVTIKVDYTFLKEICIHNQRERWWESLLLVDKLLKLNIY